MTPTSTSLASKREPEVVFFVISMRLPPSPPPSHPNMSRRWLFASFRCLCHLPHIQTRAGGGFFLSFQCLCTTTTSLMSKCEPEVVFFVISTQLPPPPHIQTRARGGPFHHFNTTPTTTSLMFKHKPEVVLFVISTGLPLPPPPSCPNTSWRWFFASFQCLCHHHLLPHIQT